MVNTRQCCSPIGNGFRCPNITVDENKMHCFQHLDIGLRLYRKYKKVCNFADSLDLDKVHSLPSLADKVTFLHKCYVAYIAAWEARMEHRNKCVVPECRDWGHELQFILIKQKIDTSESLLEEI